MLKKQRGVGGSLLLYLSRYGKIEKLLFSLKLDGDYESYLVKYDFTEEEMNNFTVSEINEKEMMIKNISNKFGNFIPIIYAIELNLSCFFN